MGHTFDNTGEPQFNDDASNGGAGAIHDIEAAVAWASKVGGLLKGTSTERMTLTSTQTRVGWIFSETDTGKLFLRVPSGWFHLPATKAGVVDQATDNAGMITVTHGLGRVPLAAIATIDDSSPVVGNHLHVTTLDRTETTFKIRVYRSGTVDGITYNNVPYGLNGVKASWVAVG